MPNFVNNSDRLLRGQLFRPAKPTNSSAPSGGWLSRYSTHKFTGAPPRLPPRMTRLVFTWTNSVPSRNNRCKLDHSGRADTGRRKHIGGFLLGNFHKGMNHDGIELRAATLYQTSPGVFM
jgi:hypothetical protein